MSSPTANTSATVGASDSKPKTVLIAVDDDESMSSEVAETARRLFGGQAKYFIIDVGEIAFHEMNWGYVYPVLSTALYEPRMLRGPSSAVRSSEDQAERRAVDVADAASLPNATALSDVGDPTAAILAAAAQHEADVIVVGSHASGWFHRLFSSSVQRDVVAHAVRPVLVVK